ncbi:MAG: hypothetical protein QNJ14_04240 [Woeseiaceae bacterium]|nr:hypothetical protein [Woeseiaceae bacterium]
MPTIEDVYWKFGFVSEAAQLLETELGTLLFRSGAIEAGLFESPDHDKAWELLQLVNRKTLGQLIRSLGSTDYSVDDLEELMTKALRERNRLTHSFYRQHNYRRNSEDGCAVMLEDLESIHETILDAYKAVMKLSGVDIETMTSEEPPTEHVPIV